MHLRACPFLELAEASPDVVCGFTWVSSAGLLGALGASAAGADLKPSAAPSACVVQMRLS
jgi:hypothetical protein